MRSFLARLFGGQKETDTRPMRRGRPRPQSVDDLEKLERIRYLRWLRRNDPEAYDAAMRGAVGLPRTRSSELQTFLSTLETLRKAGIDQVVKRDEDNLLREVVRAFGSGAALMLLQNAGIRLPVPVTQPPAPVVPESSASSHSHQTAPVVPPPSPASHAGGGGMSFASRVLIAQIADKTPEDAARWLLSQSHPAARELVQVMVKTPDEQLPALLGQVVQQAPDLAGAVNWLRSRPEWFLAAVHALRDLAAQDREESIL